MNPSEPAPFTHGVTETTTANSGFENATSAPDQTFVPPVDAQSIARDAEQAFTAFNEFQSGQIVTLGGVFELQFLGETVDARIQVVRKVNNRNAPVLKRS